MGKEYNLLVCLLGASASGKDTIARYLANQGFNYVVSTTDRPMRSNEVDGVDYHFVTKGEFDTLKKLDQFIEYRYYDTICEGKPARWQYGIERDEIDLDKGNFVTVVDIKGLEDLQKEFGNNILSIYIDAPYETRKIRAIARDRFFEEDEFKRRNADDEIRFEGIENKVDLVISNNNLDECLSKIFFQIDYTKKLRTYYSQYCSW